MVPKIVIVALSLGLVVLSLAAFGGALAPEPHAQKLAVAAPQKSLAAARVFMLLPEGKVEISDAWARRVYRWNGERWVEVEVKWRQTPLKDSR